MQPTLNGPLAALAGLFVLAVMGASGSMWVWTIQKAIRREPLLPEPKPRCVPWGAGSVGCIILLIVFLDLASSTILAALSPRPEAGAKPALATIEEPTPRNPTALLMIVAARNVVILLSVPLILATTSGATRADLGLSRQGWKRNVIRGLAACLLLAPVCYGLMIALSRMTTPQDHPVGAMLRQDFSSLTIVLALVSATILAPLAEELLFRGVLLGWLTSMLQPRRYANDQKESLLLTITDDELGDAPELDATLAHPPPPPPLSTPAEGLPDEPARYGVRFWLPNLVASLLFAALHHPQWPAPIPLFILSLGLGVLYQHTGSLWAPIALHAGFNSVSTVALLLALAAGAGKVEKTVPPPATTAPARIVIPFESESVRTCGIPGNPSWRSGGPEL
jgi:membrane protease YdiL (CAAX protease family)